jgi:hypothetical protein
MAMQYINSVVIFLIVFYTWTTNVEHNEGYLFVGTLDEFTPRWYMVIGAPIIMSLIL